MRTEASDQHILGLQHFVNVTSNFAYDSAIMEPTFVESQLAKVQFSAKLRCST